MRIGYVCGYICLAGSSQELQDCYTWCEEQFGVMNESGWVYEEFLTEGPCTSRIKFVKVEHSNWFLLRWS